MYASIDYAGFRTALFRECEADLQTRLTVLLEVARVYCHTFRCPNCQHYCPRVAGVFADVARQVGEMIHGWEIVEIDVEDFVQPQPKEIALLLRLCRAGVHVGSDRLAEIEWRTALGLSGLAVAMALEQSSRGAAVTSCFSGE